jgi:nitrous oxidase accessory protein NosD
MHGGGAAAAAAIAQAVKASGAIVRMEPNDFVQIVHRAEEPVVVMATSKIFGRTSYKYLTSYKGLAFYTKSPSQLPLGMRAELVYAKQIWIPG